jgi:diacylglycerol kinase
MAEKIIKKSLTMKARQFSIRKRANRFRFALEGVQNFFVKEPNAWVHLAATIGVFLAAWRFHLAQAEIIMLIVVTGFVWVAEVFNTAIEKIMDFISPDYHPAVKLIKDLSAAAVLVAALTALATGGLIFIPKLFSK